MLTITLAARMNVIEIAFASAVGAMYEEKEEEVVEEEKKKDDEVLSMMYLCTDAEFDTWRKYSVRRRIL